jgi:DNA-binding response OmpR family regulator
LISSKGFLPRCVAEHIGWITIIAVQHVLVATDADSVAEEVFAALADDDTLVSRVRAGTDVRMAVSKLSPDAVILDLQIGNMGGVAASLDLRLEAEAGRVPDTRILMLLDREVDKWIAKEAKADAQLVKPVDSFQLRKAVEALLAPAGS